MIKSDMAHRRLFCAVIKQAFDDISIPVKARDYGKDHNNALNDDEREAAQSYRWILDDEKGNIFSCASLCECLGMDHEAFKERAKELYRGQRDYFRGVRNSLG